MPLTEHGADAACLMIEGVGDRAVHATPAMRGISLALLASEKVTWARSGGKAKWAPRADGSKPGVLSGALRRSLTQADAEGAIREIKGDHLVFGSSLPSAKFMQGGTKAGGKQHAPKRPVLTFGPAEIKASQEIVRLHLLGELP